MLALPSYCGRIMRAKKASLLSWVLWHPLFQRLACQSRVSRSWQFWPCQLEQILLRLLRLDILGTLVITVRCSWRVFYCVKSANQCPRSIAVMSSDDWSSSPKLSSFSLSRTEQAMQATGRKRGAMLPFFGRCCSAKKQRALWSGHRKPSPNACSRIQCLEAAIPS